METATAETNTNQDTALQDLTERAFSRTQDLAEAQQWLALRSLKRSADTAHLNWKDARRLAGRAVEGEKMEDEMKIHCPETHHHYPPPPPQTPSTLSKLAKPLIGLAAAGVLGASGVGAAYVVAEALASKVIPEAVDTDSTLLQQFVPQDSEWINNE